MGIFVTGAISVPPGPRISLKYTFPLYFSRSPAWFSPSLVPFKACHPLFAHLDVPPDHASPAEMKRAGEMAGGPFIHRPPLDTSSSCHGGGRCHEEETCRLNRDLPDEFLS